MPPCISGSISVEWHDTGRGLTQELRTDDGRVLCVGDPDGDVALRVAGGTGVRGARFASWSAAGGAGSDSTGSAVRAVLERAGCRVCATVAPAPDAQGFDVTMRLTALAPVRLTALRACYALPSDAALDHAWVPGLKSGPRDVIGDHVFRSPCIILRQSGTQVSLVPHLDAAPWAGSPPGPLRATLDLSLSRRGPRFSMGLQDYAPHGHVYYRPTGRAAALERGDTLGFGFTLLVETGAHHFSFQSVLRFLWKRYGEGNLAAFLGQPGFSFDECARLFLGDMLERHRLWRGFTLDGAECGGICARIVFPGLNRGMPPLPRDTTPAVAANYLLRGMLTPREKAAFVASAVHGIHPHFHNALFMNNVRTSFGMAYYGRLWADAALESRARAIWRLALAAPAPAGIFPAVFTGDGRHPRWVAGTRVWRYTRAHHVPNAAVTGLWMLEIDRHLGSGGIFRERCGGLGDFLLRVQQPSGAIPTWVDAGRGGALRPLPALRESAGGAAAGLFLARLAAETGREDCRAAARRAADFIMRRVFPSQQWHDTEVFFSCSEKPLGWRDGWTGVPAQGTLCMAWAAGLMGELYTATREARYRDYGRAILDLLLLFQQIWSPPFIGIDPRGGFGVMNTDAEWNDARQAELGLLLLSWHGITGEPELALRGRAALRAAFTLMRREEEHRGAVPENYGHVGRDLPIQGYVMPDWGGGTAVAAAALAQIRYGASVGARG
jgi:hypothetical protein